MSVELDIDVFNSECIENDLFTYSSVREGTRGVNFDEAQEKCVEEGGNLVRFANENEFDVTVSLRSGRENATWVGIQLLQQQGEIVLPTDFVFTDSEERGLDFIQVGFGEFPWGAGEPNAFNDTSEECVHFFAVNDDLNDVTCSVRFPSYSCRIVDSASCNNSALPISLIVGGIGLVAVFFIVILLIVFKRKHSKKFILTEKVERNRSVSGIDTLPLSANRNKFARPLEDLDRLMESPKGSIVSEFYNDGKSQYRVSNTTTYAS